MDNKLDDALGRIAAAFAGAMHPAVLYSGGHDSQLVLWLARQTRSDVVAVYCQMVDDPRKDAFVHETCAMWGVPLDVRRPHERDLIARGAHVEVVNLFGLAGQSLIHIGLQPVEPERNARRLCALQLRFEDLPARADWPYDVVLMGQRDDDEDAAYGRVPVGRDEIVVEGVHIVFPIRRWSNADVWAVIFDEKIPQNWRRYDRQTGARLQNSGWGIGWDNDRYHLCTNCLEPNLVGVDIVECPRAGRAAYLGDQIDLEARRQMYERAIVNVNPGEISNGSSIQ